ncbi:cell wall hydrolase [Hephaestia sp. GCM10023244]|uniref:cell wall hydrolase n=1 Tax=unclassified Hephaestia TaxID=2631281 RepID=UPI0020770C02|nr:cell wall hydrolase [Hephaestia sp. MAHUQ-44]MCM8731165.1 cell wall hydrolase [Hephaestia sp. MAHUQ-44]
MTVSQRVAAAAAFLLCVSGIGALTSPGAASELASAALDGSSPASDLANVPTSITVPTLNLTTRPVPAPDGVQVQMIPVEDAVADADYASLAEAVAAQAMPDEVDPQLSCLAGAIYFESKGEPLSGQLAVANVIMNRVESGRFPSTICGVVTQPGQFSFVRGGKIPSIDPARKAYRTAMAVAQVAMTDDWSKDPAPDALFFHAKRVRPGWGKAQVATIGHHVFYR